MGGPIYVVRMHDTNKQVEQTISELCRDVGAENVVLVFDDTKPGARLPPGFAGTRALETVLGARREGVALLHSNAEMHVYNKYHISAWHNGHEPYMFLHACFAELDYDFIFMFEYDVRCCGSWRNTFDKCSHRGTDYLANYLGDPKKYPDVLWASFIGEGIPPMEQRLVALFAVTRCSRRFVKAIHDHRNVMDAYCEVYLPTLAKKVNMTVGTFPSNMISQSFNWTVFKSLVGWEKEKSEICDIEVDFLFHAIK